MSWYIYFGIVVGFLCAIWVFWRYYWFFRDPERKIPPGNSIVSPADGEIVYVKKVKHGKIPISQKKGKTIDIREDVKLMTHGEKYLVGIFMTPLNVHVQRAPIAGKVVKTNHYAHKNLPMTIMWMRTFFGFRPFYKYSRHMWENERNVILIKGKFPVYVIQIADIAVNKVVCWVKRNQKVMKGERIGMIKMGSQVDVLFHSKDVKIKVKEGDKVKAGSSIIATFK